MSHHLVAFTASVANSGNVDVTALSDQVLAISNNHFLPQEDWQLLWAASMSATAQRTRIVSPSNRMITLPFIRPLILAAIPNANPNVAWYLENPFRIRGLEELAVEHSQGAVGAERVCVLLGLQRSYDPVPRGDEFTMRGTGTTTLVANAWTNVPVTWADNLPVGEYTCTGLEAIGTTIQAARMIFENQVERPGCIGNAIGSSRQFYPFSQHQLGAYGKFRPTRMPIVEVLGNAADTAQEFYLKFLRTR
jgi:hypothetical protein